MILGEGTRLVMHMGIIFLISYVGQRPQKPHEPRSEKLIERPALPRNPAVRKAVNRALLLVLLSTACRLALLGRSALAALLLLGHLLLHRLSLSGLGAVVLRVGR